MEYQETSLINKLEDSFWWHQHLYEKVYLTIKKQFKEKKDIKILDLGSGTGGLLLYLKNRGYNNLYGIDNTTEAVSLSNEKKLNVIKGDLFEFDYYFEKDMFDVIIALDSLYFIPDSSKKEFTAKLFNKSNPNSIAIINLPAFNILKGNHDRMAQIPYRFTNSIFELKFGIKKINIIKNIYWPLTLSPLILILRLFQQLKLKIDPNISIKSDVEETNPFLNKIFKHLCDFEFRYLNNKVFGSSLFVVLKLNS